MDKRIKRQETSASQGLLRALCVALTVVLLGMIAYGVLCTNVMHSEKILPNTYALGVDLGGLTEEEAEEQVESLLTAQYATETLDIVVGNETVSVRVADMVQVDGSYAAKAAMSGKEDLTFLQCGIGWLRAKTHSTTVGAGEAVTFYNLDSIFSQLETAIANAEMDPVDTSYALVGDQISITKGVSGQTVNQDQLKADVLTALEEGNFTTPIPCPMTTISPADFDLQAAYDAVYTPAVNASCDREGNILSECAGYSFDLTAAQAALDSAAEGETVWLDLVYESPTLTASELEELLFRDVLGTCTTTVGGTANRVNNVKLAASACDDYILLPGETFSYNDTVGERTAERGYKEAGAYVSGETVEVLGGGICQVSSTIYLATLRANLEMTERHNHTYVSSYMPYGEDATVSWGGPDFQFTNNTDYPIKLSVIYYGGQLTAKVYGTNLTGEYVEVTNEVLSTTSYETVYEDTTELAAGQTKVKTTGYNGMKVKVYRNVYAADGTLISSTLESNNTYATRNKVILRGVSG